MQLPPVSSRSGSAVPSTPPCPAPAASPASPAARHLTLSGSLSLPPSPPRPSPTILSLPGVQCGCAPRPARTTFFCTMFSLKFALVASLLLLSTAALELDVCKSEGVWARALRDYIFLSESSLGLRIDEWNTFCDTLPVEMNMSDYESLQSAWQAHTRLVPLSECFCEKSSSSALEADAFIPPSVFVDYPILGIILAVLFYLLRLYRSRADGVPSLQPAHARYHYQPSDGGSGGPKLLR